MKQTIWKFTLGGIENTFMVPENGVVRYVGKDPETGNPAVWVQVDSSAVSEKRVFMIVGTGHQVESTDEFLGTVVCEPSVWHVFERK